jgi:hypothetical protein
MVRVKGYLKGCLNPHFSDISTNYEIAVTAYRSGWQDYFRSRLYFHIVIAKTSLNPLREGLREGLRGALRGALRLMSDITIAIHKLDKKHLACL